MIVGILASQKTASTTWTYIGDSGANNGTVTKSAVYGACDSSSAVGTWLTSNYPPSGYGMGYIMRVNHSYYDDNFDIFDCTSHYYQAS